MTRSDFLRREDRRRSLLSWGIAAGFYTLAFLSALILGLTRPSELSELPSPVWISLQGPPEAPALPPKGPPGAPELVEGPAFEGVAPSPVPSLAPLAGPAPAAPAATKPASPQPEPSGGAPAAESPTGAAAALPAAPAEPWIPGPRAPGSRIISSETGGSEIPRSGGGFSTRIQGSEQGNSLETRLGGAADKVGRSLYVPVYLYLPLPSRLDEALVSRLPGPQAEPFLAYYEKTSSGYRLVKQPPLSERDRLWIGLEDAGYDLGRAEYKAGRKLSPVELEFVVTPAANGAQPRLEALRITGSSGDRAIDEAVQYGFRRATFFNSTEAAVSGSFSYRFD